MALAEQYAARRAAHRFVAEAIKRATPEPGRDPDWAWRDEVERIRAAHEAAGAIEDTMLEAQSLVTQVTPTLVEQKAPRPFPLECGGYVWNCWLCRTSGGPYPDWKIRDDAAQAHRLTHGPHDLKATP